MIRLPFLDPSRPDRFPPVELALADPDGLLAGGGDLSPERLLAAYARGIFPWFSDGEPILWWSPSRRTVFDTAAMHVPRRLARWLRGCGWTLRADTAFGAVVRACAAPRAKQRGTWITADMIAAYERLHALGHAHSVEAWDGDRLVGGVYGVALGRMFYGESMFSRESDASKVALVRLCRQLAQWEFGLVDCQMETPHLASLGARTLPRAAFAAQVAELVNLPHRAGPWSFDASD